MTDEKKDKGVSNNHETGRTVRAFDVVGEIGFLEDDMAAMNLILESLETEINLTTYETSPLFLARAEAYPGALRAILRNIQHTIQGLTDTITKAYEQPEV